MYLEIMSKRAIISFSGFQESEDNRNGFEDGFFRIVSLFSKPGEIFVYAPRTWKSNVKALADQLRRQRINSVAVLSYSHGQAAITAFARYAYEIGLDLDLWIACDPVYRPTWLPRCTLAQAVSIRAMLKKGKIKIPKGIKRTVYVRQELDRPNGHDLVACHPDQTVELAGVFHTYGHSEIDEAPEFWKLVKDELSIWSNPPKAIPLPE
jgi:hypothetical protein